MPFLGVDSWRWQYFAGQPLTHSPAVTPTTVYQYVEGQGVAAIDKTQGEAIRKAKWLVADAIQFLSEDEKYAYLERKDHSIVGVDKANGAVKFASQRKDFVAFGSAIKDNVVFATTADGKVLAIVPVTRAGTMGEVVMEGVDFGALASVH